MTEVMRNRMAVTVPVGSDLSIRRSGFKASNFNFWDNSWAPVFTLDLKANSSCVRSRQVICMSVPVQQASVPKVIVSPLELEAASEPPLNLHKPKQPYTTIVSVERIVGPKAPGETCHIVIDHGGNVPYWEGQSYGFIPPGENPKKPGSPYNVRLYSIDYILLHPQDIEILLMAK
ncbi:ferredoxin--NADP reductase, root isozyme, chloroplastic-like isoform X3 [Lotus japonicus]|uniref:ferredoxin--NADP reductase, root isozyme, chloroplastic-like isoform X3 n=1 Tax=Lotus japonicus TaxID=34305 RepID=UPI002586CCC6|nr:ferredoxin--NADP reductase, root isozyme, chloroplastic-like isoform X3 [Lotus japonicus]